mmetsp:Transcript_52055/g.170120  ORF Transcript_52055/g.170120 Transcript_52055/m.170120 type:complete len:204 (-) Transcript_52055:194-805(-)
MRTHERWPHCACGVTESTSRVDAAGWPCSGARISRRPPQAWSTGGRPTSSAWYTFATSRAANCRPSSTAALLVFATRQRPETGTSSRCRASGSGSASGASRGGGDSSAVRASSSAANFALLPALVWMPGGLKTTATASSSWSTRRPWERRCSTKRARACSRFSDGLAAAGGCSCSTSPCCTRRDFSTASPLTRRSPRLTACSA